MRQIKISQFINHPNPLHKPSATKITSVALLYQHPNIDDVRGGVDELKYEFKLFDENYYLDNLF